MAEESKREFPRLATRVPITLDKPRVLLFDMMAVWDVEMAYNNKVGGQEKSFSEILGGGTAGGIVCLLWGGLRHEDAGLTLAQAAALFRPVDIPWISRLIVAAATDQAMLPKTDKDEEETKKNLPTESAGESSGATGG